MKFSLKNHVLTAVLTGLALHPLEMHAQQAGVVGQSERQIKIQQDKAAWARGQVLQAQTALSPTNLHGIDYVTAFALSKSALDVLPSSGNATAGLRSMALETFSKAAYGLARMRVSQGRFEDAELAVGAATGKPYDSTYPPLLSLKNDLQSPDRLNRTVTPAFVAKIEDVKQLLSDAQGYYDSGRFDDAFKAYERVLNIDPQNSSARLGMEQVNKQRTDYATEAYNERRGEMLEQVAKAWELPVTKFDMHGPSPMEQNPIEVKGAAFISRKLREIRIPQLTVQDENIREAIDKLQKKSRAFDIDEKDPSRKGVNIVLKIDPSQESGDGSTKINLSLSDLPLGDALKYVASAANLQVKVEPYAVAIVPQTEPIETLISKEYKVPPGFITSVASSSSSAAAAGGAAGLPQTTGKSGAKEFLETQGVTFPPGSSAIYLAQSSKLLVKNTQSNLDLIDSLVEVSPSTPSSQVEIEARFLEVTQNNLQELGFDWLLGAFNLAGGSGVYGGGGTKGNQQGGGPYPFSQTAAPAGPVGNITGDGTGNLTAGNRTGSAAISANALDGLLFGSPVGPAAGVLALAGVFTNPQFQVVLRAINQQKGVDLVSAPKVTVKNGAKATINITRKFPYPRDYSPPQVPQTQGNGSINPATPATPTSFETRNVGVQLEVEPTVSANNYTIELVLSPQITEFQGFVNYGSPIQTVAPVYFSTGITNIVTDTKTVVLTPNVINQPVFSVREVTTDVFVYDGQTVVLGGLLREDVQKVQDKTPILGDIPLAGALFRSSANQRIKRNLLIFVTAGLLDPAGQPLIKTIENDKEVPAPDAKALTSEAVPGDPSSASRLTR
jgi:general secretion pathway protein D